MSIPFEADAGSATPASATWIGTGALAGLDLVALRGLWRSLYGSQAPTSMSPSLLRLAVAYRLQEQQHGGLSAAAKARLARIAKGGGRDAQVAAAERRVDTHYAIKPGTRFLREWHGRTHEVTAMADGRFDYRGQAYRSLSAIAREITGTRWSGPAFFGLRSDG